MPDLNYMMEGYYIFRYLKENEEVDDSQENIQDIDP